MRPESHGVVGVNSRTQLSKYTLRVGVQGLLKLLAVEARIVMTTYLFRKENIMYKKFASALLTAGALTFLVLIIKNMKS